jgi:gas vesicle protein
MEKGAGNRASSIFLAFLAGSLVGAAIGMLLAPSTGRETREKVLRTAADIASKAADAARRAKEEAEGILEKLKETLKVVEGGGPSEG